MNLLKMKRVRMNKCFALLIAFVFVPLFCAAQGPEQIGEATASSIIIGFYNDLNFYAEQSLIHEGKEAYYQHTRERILSDFATDAVVKMDICHLVNEKIVPSTMGHYLTVLNRISKDQKVKFEVVDNPKMKDSEKNQVQVTVNVLSTENSFQNTIVFTFKGKKIVSFDFNKDDLKRIKNIEGKPKIKEPDPVYSLEPELSYGAGVKLGSNIGVSAGLSIGGLSENWFVSRLKFGVEYFKPHGMKEYIHYPTSSNGQPSTMTYETIKDGDFGLGINMGYTFIPGKHHLSNHHLTAFMGIGGSFYDFWYEKTGASKSDYASHHSSALYLKPSLRYDFKIIGVEVGYYFCPNYSPMQGMSIQLIINL